MSQYLERTTETIPVTPRQLRYLHALMRRAEVEHDQRHAYAADQLGREVTTLSTLTMVEASALLDALERQLKAAVGAPVESV